jgi:chemotaxis signal transduction protein
MTDSFLSELQSVAKQNNWQVAFGVDSLLDASALPLSELKKALPALFETAKRFVVRVTDSESANTIVQNVRSQFGDAALRNVSLFEVS